jgi:hypothetical protein
MYGAVLSGNAVNARRLLYGHVDNALWRLRAQEALRAGVLVLTILAWVLLPLLLCDRLFSLMQAGFNIWFVWGGLAALSIPYMIWRVFSQRINERLAAVLADERLGLHSRLCTALALGSDDPTGFTDVFYAEAAERLARLDVTKAFPIEMPRLAYLLPIPLIFSFCIWRFMEPQDRMGWVAEAKKKRAQEDGRKKSVEKLLDMKLQDMKKEVEDKTVQDSNQYKVNQLVKKAQEVAKQVKEGKLNQEEALQALAELKREVGETRENLKPDQDIAERLKALKAGDLNLEENDMTKQISEALKNGDLGLAAKEMRRLAEKVKKDILEDKKKTPEQKAEELKKLQKEMEKLAGALAEQQELGGQLQEISKEAMEAGDYEKLQQQVKEQLAKEGKSAEQMANELQAAMEQAAGEMEQMEEAEGATDEQADEALEQLDENVDEALDGICPGGDNAGQDGQQGGKQGGQQGGKQGGGGKKVAKAGGKRGGRRTGQPGKQGNDGGNGNKDGDQGKNGPPGNGMGGGGPGVGQRAYNENDADFKTEKVKGKMQSGAITALSSFRGQGAKSEVPQEYVKSLQAADQEAASSLELDRVPADAKKMIQEYFSSLKKDAGMPGGGGRAPAPRPAGPAPKAQPRASEDEVLRE